jgi:hypothetical protein
VTTRRQLIDLNDQLVDYAIGIHDRAEARSSKKLSRMESEMVTVIVKACEQLNEVIDTMPARRYPSPSQLSRLYLRGGSPSALIRAIDDERGI